MKQLKTYPSIAGSWGIILLVFLSMIILSLFAFLKPMLGGGVVMLITYILSFGIPLFFILKRRQHIMPYATFDFSEPSLFLVLLSILATVGILFGLTIPLNSIIPMPELFERLFREVMNDARGLPGFITIVLAAPILEEWLFRGVILDGLLRRYSPIKSILLSSFLFGFIHLNPWQFCSAMLFGIFAGWIYYRTRKLLLPMIIHATNNFIGYLSLFLQDEELVISQSLVDEYGTMTRAILIAAGGIVLLLLTLYLLKRVLRHTKVPFPLIEQESEKRLEYEAPQPQ